MTTVSLEERQRILMQLYASRQKKAISKSEIVRRAIEALCSDITQEEIDAELAREKEEERAERAMLED